jgi:hypothetical protein
MYKIDAAVEAFRPWNTDSMGTVVGQTEGTVTIAYDHDPSKRYTFKNHELDRVGRFVPRDAF